ncbi:hypothetical protein E4U43_008618 [Claviceps pusilla]|uniref:Uncharacterized protein n=1 Tax=Claviceps pusilla TaxID=123648 RepID=A0A9P7NCG5_9HYPO|nr:hypothetical protein E4U43_008618 [Claviceps pusilla]
MPSTQPRKPPSAGTKVHAGKNAPVTREGAGPVLSDSLAAESYETGGKFGENRDAEPENASYDPACQASSRANGAGVRGTQADTAPSYITSQYTSDTHGPHGKNLKEEDFDYQQVFDGQQRAFNAEAGSINDPGRLAEVGFEKKNAATPRAAASRDSKKLSTGTVYDGLERDVSA